jgi:RNA polymerase sigma-70 factor, ECF subfamily
MIDDLNSSGGVLAQLVPMRRYARALTRDESAAEDLVHDALVRAYERRATFRDGGNLRTWLLSIVHNTFVDQKRRQQAERRYEAETAPLAEVAAPASQENSVQLAEIQRAFSNLPAEQRAVLHLVGIEGLKYREAADILDIPVGTLMSRLGRARAALRPGGAEDEPGDAGQPARSGGRAKLTVVAGDKK